jgi:hypothetical protein
VLPSHPLSRMLARPSPKPETAATPEVSLLLRAHSEQRWLSREVVPVVRQIATREGLPEEQLGAALAYLEVIWCEAVARAGDTDKALTCLDLSLPAPRSAARSADCQALAMRARRYRAAVLVLREAVARRVAELLAAPEDGMALGSEAFTSEDLAEPEEGASRPYPSWPPASSSSSL